MQADILKEFIAQKEYIFPPRPSMRIIVDMIRYCTEHMPKWNSISISGYHIREAGSTAAQELAFTLRDGIEYVQWCVDAGMDVDSFAPRLSFFFNSHSDFFEEIAKFRAARRIWARTMKERFGAKNPRSLDVPLPHPDRGREPDRAAALQQRGAHRAAGPGRRCSGGTQSLHTNSLDEALALPTEEAVTIALRTQQVIAARVRASSTPPTRSAGSYFVEKLTNDIEAEALEYFRRIDAMGGMVAAVERGFPQREIQEAAFQFQQAVERKEKIIVGVNDYVMDEKPLPDPLHRRDRWRRSRSARVERAARRAATTARVRAAPRATCKEAARGTGQHDVSASSRRRAPTRPSARCATPCARSGASTTSRRCSEAERGRSR